MNAKTRAGLGLTVGLMLMAGTATARTLTLGTVYGARDVSTQAMEHWNEALSEATEGRWSLSIVPGGTLGGDREMLQQLSTGEIDINLSSPVVMQYVAPQYQCLEAEYIYDSEEQGFAVWRGDIGKAASQAMKDAHGIEIAAVGRRGARLVTANKPILKPEDLAGLKFRVTNNLRSEVFAAYGAQPAPLPLSELYGALRQGVFDAQENPLSTIFSLRFHEVQSHISETNHIWTYNLVLTNSALMDELGEDRAAFESTLAQSLEWLYTAIDEENARIRAEIEASGSAVFDKPDTQAFRDAARPILAAYAEESCAPGLLDAVDAVAASN
ncbi:TRAP transporter substrate-binding protein [Cereibacter sphaeroides]|uniref:TRAP transporter substrate-binding protein n=1 Tax=Cereibacter sphaeroides TaxID=1063 RepID=A0AAX1UG88_CERSP|nr:TRAP transporter substrate-binding protein [Cereibacter sphaeroides]RHZ91386.1 TRAP transporter substrate-binding protein [Cereibacter sphaeroides]